MEIPQGPAGDPYDWYQRAGELLSSGNADAAIVLLEWLYEVDQSTSVLEIYGRALMDARRHREAIYILTLLLERSPDNDWAHYAIGQAHWRSQDFVPARDHLALAFVMRPDREEYGRALSQVKATLRSRVSAGLPLNGPIEADFDGGSSTTSSDHGDA